MVYMKNTHCLNIIKKIIAYTAIMGLLLNLKEIKLNVIYMETIYVELEV